MTPGSRRRFLVAYLVALAVAAVGSTLAIREVLVMRHDDEVSAALGQELAELEAFLEEGRNPATGGRFSSVRELLMVYLDRQNPDDEALLAYADGSFLREESDRFPLAFVPPRQTQAFAALSARAPERGETEGTFETRVGEARFLARPIEIGATTGVYVVAAVPGDALIEIREDVETWGVPVMLGIVLIASVFGLGVTRLFGGAPSFRR